MREKIKVKNIPKKHEDILHFKWINFAKYSTVII